MNNCTAFHFHHFMHIQCIFPYLFRVAHPIQHNRISLHNHIRMSLQVKLVNAVLTHDTQLLSNMDPYCILRLGPQTFRSRTKNEAGKRPVWNETFTFTSNDHLLKLTVMDEDTITDDTVGEGTIDITRFRNNPTQQQELVQLFYHGKSAGKVQLFIRGLGSGSTNNNFGVQPNVMPNLLPGVQAINSYGQSAGWGGQPMQNGQWGNNVNPQLNPYGVQPQPPVNPNYMGNQMPNQWGNLNTNNGWGSFQPQPNFNQQQPSFNQPQPSFNQQQPSFNQQGSNNLYPSLDNPSSSNSFNPLNVMGQVLSQQVNNTPPNNVNNNMNQMGMQNNVPLQFQMINGMGMLNKNPYGNNPYQ